MVKLVSVAEMHSIEKAADAGGLTYARMLENAGGSLAKTVVAHSHKDRSILALVGSGNNGGDTLVALGNLSASGWNVAAYLVGRSVEEEYVNRARAAGAEIYSLETDPDLKKLKDLLTRNTVRLDGLLGTGIRLPIRPDVSRVLVAASEIQPTVGERAYVIAVDFPSGMDCDSGAVAPETLRADLTLTMAAVKSGMLTLPAFEYLGDLEVGDIGLPDDLREWVAIKHFVLDEAMARAPLLPRPLTAHKGTFGTALIVAGSRQFPGSALLAGKAAYRTGTGLVTIAAPESMQPALVGQLPEATWLPLAEEDGWIAGKAAVQVEKGLGRATATLLGPGFGQEDTTGEFVQKLLKTDLPAPVVDADALKLLSKLEDWPERLPKNSVLTPHPKEMSILTKLDVEKIQAGRLETAVKYAQLWKHVVVLKGAFSVVAAPDGRAAMLPVATPALARAGTGDVLAGIITGIRAQGVPAFEAACTGVWLHGQAGLRAAARLGGTAGVLAGDLINELPALIGQ
jgi:hydroxyethylthiazole kinase-like uncharacterized protein yjeF